MSSIRTVRTGNVFEETLSRLLRAISLGQYMVGEKLPAERELAESLGVSRATLRDVLHELQETGVLDIKRGRYGGAFIIGLPADHELHRPIDESELNDALQFRAVLDAAAARLAAEAPLTGEQRRHLREACDACDTAEPGQYRQLDSRFHLAIAELTGIPSLHKAAAEVRDRVNAMLDRIPMITTNLAHSDEQHRAILEAVLNGNPLEAEHAALEHARGTAALLVGYLKGS